MKHGQIETLKIRLKSIFFVLFTLAVFKPFGIDALQWHTCLYLLVFLIPGGMLVCMLTDALLKYVCRMPHMLASFHPPATTKANPISALVFILYIVCYSATQALFTSFGIYEGFIRLPLLIGKSVTKLLNYIC